MIIMPEDKAIISLLPAEDARLFLLALFSEDDDLPEMTPLVQMAYTAVKSKSDRISSQSAARGRSGGAPTGNQNARKQSKQSKQTNGIDEDTEAENQSKTIKTNNAEEQPENNQKQATVSGTVTQSVSVTVTNTDSPTLTLPGDAPNGVVVSADQKESKEQKKREEQQQSEWFEQFWKPYLRKKHKPDVRKVWDKLKVTEQLFGEIMAGLQRWMDSDQWRDGKIENPKKFLEGRQWEDDPPMSINGSARGRPKSSFVVGSIGQTETEEQRKERFARLIE